VKTYMNHYEVEGVKVLNLAAGYYRMEGGS